jgi:hypothetical protein
MFMYGQDRPRSLRPFRGYTDFWFRALPLILFLQLGMCNTLAGQAQISEDSPIYRLPHYDEDWSGIHNSPHNTNFLDDIKDIALGEGGDSYVSFGGEIRETYERFHNPNFGLQPQDPAGYLLQRYLVHADVHANASMRAYVELLSALENWRKGGPRPIVDEDKLDFHQGFLDFDFGRKLDNRAVVRIGRQEMALGSGRLVALREGTNIPFSFDGVHTLVRAGVWNLDIFATKPVLNKIGIMDDVPQAGSWFWGVYASRAINVSRHQCHVDIYYLGFDRNPTRFNQGTAKEVRHTIGARIWNLKGAWEYDAEGLFQFGSFGRGDIRAWRVASDTSYGFTSVRWQPRLGFAVDAASGDRDSSDPNLQTFNALFQSGTYSGRAQILGSANTIRIEPSFRATPRRGITISAGWGFYWRESIRDGLYGIAGNLLVPGNTANARYEGSRPTFEVDWQVNRHLSTHLNYISVFNGPFGLQAIHGTSGMSYVSPWVTYEF